MAAPKITITPKTRVGELLNSYPELEPVLMAMSPAFEKLKNPLLRKTVAKVATLQQVSVVGGLNVDEMVRSLRKAVGQSAGESVSDQVEHQPTEAPDWFDKAKISGRYDATPIINSGESPLSEILRLASFLKEGEILELRTPFIPAPVLDMLRAKNFRIYTVANDTCVLNYICK